jgi:hypothetical protein
MAKKKDTPKKSVQDSPSELVFYSNIASVSLTPEEAILHFGQRDSEDPNKGEGVAKVYLSLPHAKRLASVLAKGLSRHEEVFGEIIADPEKRLSPEILKKIVSDGKKDIKHG